MQKSSSLSDVSAWQWSLDDVSTVPWTLRTDATMLKPAHRERQEVRPGICTLRRRSPSMFGPANGYHCHELYGGENGAAIRAA